MELERCSTYPASRVWSAPDFSMGFHQFAYIENQYDGLAHIHGEYSIVMCTSGAIEILRCDRRDFIQEGEILVVNPGELHRCHFGLDHAHSCGVTLTIRRSALRAILEEIGLNSSSPDFFFTGKTHNREAFELMGRLMQEFEQKKSGYLTIVRSIVVQVLVHLLRAWPSDLMTPCQFHLDAQLPWLHMHRATEYMNGHGKAAFRFSDLCLDTGVSSSRFIPLFKNSAGISPHVYYNSLLVFKARRLLRVEGASTKEAAHALGFRNVSHFCNLFHHVTGANPKADCGSIDRLLDPRRL